jgi:hypothetical protein
VWGGVNRGRTFVGEGSKGWRTFCSCWRELGSARGLGFESIRFSLFKNVDVNIFSMIIVLLLWSWVELGYQGRMKEYFI